MVSASHVLLVDRSRRPLRNDPTKAFAKSAQLGSSRAAESARACSSDSRTIVVWETLRRSASAATLVQRAEGSFEVLRL